MQSIPSKAVMCKVFIPNELMKATPERGKPQRLAGAFFHPTSIVAGRAELNRQLRKTKTAFVLCRLWRYSQVWGVDNFSHGEKPAAMKILAGFWAGSERRVSERQGQIRNAGASPLRRAIKRCRSGREDVSMEAVKENGRDALLAWST